MKRNLFSRRILAASLAASAALVGPARLHAEDIDIFTAGNGVTAPANVLIVLDNSSNWSATLGANECNSGNTAANTKFAAEICALKLVADAMPATVRMGLMMFAETGENGGYVRFGIRDMNTTNKTAFKNMLSAFVASGSNPDNSGSNQPYGKVMYEAFKYFGGYTSPANAQTNVPGSPVDRTHFGNEAFAGGGGTNASGAHRLDASNNNNPSDRAAVRYGVVDQFAYSSKTSNLYEYNNAIVDGCSKNFIIFISNGNPSTGGDSGGVATAPQLLSNVGATTLSITSGGTEVHASKFDEFAKFLYDTDVSPRVGQQRVITYTIAVYQPQNDGSISNTDSEMIKLMASGADAGGGEPFTATTAAAIKNALLKILNDVQAVNSVFVSASLPVSVNTQGTYLNQVYMGMFRPDGTGHPRWLGNLKQYKFIQDSSGDLFLGDSLDARAVNASTGFVSPAAVSFWTSASAFWANSPSGTPASANDSPDGEVVEKGGAAEQVRKDFATAQTPRRVLTCAAASCAGAPTDFNTTTITGAAMQTAFGVLTAAELSGIVNWVRGQDNVNGTPCDPTTTGCAWTSKERGPGWSTTVRPSVHGDVLHSRPVVLNYDGLGPYVFYGSNDGTLRAVKGGNLASDGHESWSFVAPEFYSKFKRLRDGTPELRTPGTPPELVPLTLPKDYFFDGPIGIYESGSTKWIFVGVRRGGPVLYAFDVSDPVNPSILWKKTGADLAQLGQMWSVPWAFRKSGQADPLLIFGAGYDPGEDATPVTSTGVGRGIYVLNARTGIELGFINSGPNGAITNPIASDMSLLSSKLAIDNSSTESGVYRAFVGDLGGNVWRLDIPSGSIADWRLFKLAALGADRKFLFAPDVVHAGDKDVVLVGSGDRERPLVTTSSDSFYALFDSKVDIGVAASMTPIVTSDLTLLTSLSGTAPSTKGWYRNLAGGEKVVNSPLTVAGITYFSTNKPTPPTSGECTANLGEARAYAVTFNSGEPPGGPGGMATSLSTVLKGGGLPPSPVGGVVELSPGKLVTFVIGGGTRDSAIEAGRVRLSIPKTRKKVYWNTKSDN